MEIRQIHFLKSIFITKKNFYDANRHLKYFNKINVNNQLDKYQNKKGEKKYRKKNLSVLTSL